MNMVAWITGIYDMQGWSICRNRNKEIFEWYLDYEALYEYLDVNVPIESRILEVGCGTSSMKLE